MGIIIDLLWELNELIHGKCLESDIYKPIKFISLFIIYWIPELGIVEIIED